MIGTWLLRGLLALGAGLVVSAVTGEAAAGVLGMLVAFVVLAALGTIRRAWRAGGDEGATHWEQERLLCIPKGRVAECVLRRDDRSGRWLDVECCSLADGGRPTCEKRCLVLMNDVYRAAPPHRPALPAMAGAERT